MTYTDTQLKRALAKMLPTELQFGEPLAWKQVNQNYGRLVLDTELLHLCWLVEEEMDGKRMAYDYSVELRFVINPDHGFVGDYRYLHATWQQRVIALAKVKGVEIV